MEAMCITTYLLICSWTTRSVVANEDWQCIVQVARCRGCKRKT